MLALGKLGGRGLDYDSILILILVYDDSAVTGAAVTNAEYYSRAAETFRHRIIVDDPRRQSIPRRSAAEALWVQGDERYFQRVVFELYAGNRRRLGDARVCLSPQCRRR